jgi:RNA polymerase sigma factor (sigma-70 family)
LSVQSDERLVRLVREGHERAFEALVNRYRRPLLRYCRGLGLGEARAEDVLQLTLLNAWLALSDGTEVRELRPWLYRIAHNAAVNTRRGASERNVELSEPALVLAGDAGEAQLERTIAVSDALAEVAALPARQRQAILLTAIEGKTHDEVASLLGVNQDAVRGLIYRARTTLRGAAAVAPQPFLGWASSASGPAGDRLSELSAGGAVGLTGALLKGVAVAVTAAVLAGGAVVVHTNGVRARAPERRSVAASAARGGAGSLVPGPVREPAGAPVSSAASRAALRPRLDPAAAPRRGSHRLARHEAGGKHAFSPAGDSGAPGALAPASGAGARLRDRPLLDAARPAGEGEAASRGAGSARDASEGRSGSPAGHGEGPPREHDSEGAPSQPGETEGPFGAEVPAAGAQPHGGHYGAQASSAHGLANGEATSTLNS